MTVQVTELLGRLEEEPFRDRARVDLPVAWDEASRRRLRRAAADDTDVAIVLETPAYLAEGAVLHDDGERIIVVSRPLEPALVVRFDAALSADRLVEQAVAVGHAFGNQHVPVEIVDGTLRVPMTTSEPVARATIAGLALSGVSVEIAEVALGSRLPLLAGHAHRDDDDKLR
jgi:urease accessory protein